MLQAAEQRVGITPNMEFTAIVLLRGGSKGIPHKNMRPMAGKPLFAWAIDEALASNIFSTLYISSEDNEIKDKVGSYYGDQVTVLDRPVSLATDDAGSDDVVCYHLPQLSGEVITLIQATSPLTRRSHFQGARDKLICEKADSLLTVVRETSFLWNETGSPVNYDFRRRPMRQEFEGVLVENGGFYMAKRWIWETCRNRLGGRITLYEMPDRCRIEIDEPIDWIIAETLLKEEYS